MAISTTSVGPAFWGKEELSAPFKMKPGRQLFDCQCCRACRSSFDGASLHHALLLDFLLPLLILFPLCWCHAQQAFLQQSAIAASEPKLHNKARLQEVAGLPQCEQCPSCCPHTCRSRSGGKGSPHRPVATSRQCSPAMASARQHPS